MNPVLSLLGLALRGGRLAAGEEPAALAAQSGKARLLLTAQDAGASILRRAEHLAEDGHCLRLSLPFSKTELGGALGRGSVAIAALTDLGLAAAVVERLAALDPDAYGGASERMALKVRRAAERKSAPRRKPPERPGNGRREGPSHPKKRPPGTAAPHGGAPKPGKSRSRRRSDGSGRGGGR